MKNTRLVIAFISAVLGVSITAAIMLTQYHTIEVVVTSKEWQREIQIENFLPRQWTGWDEEVPTDAYNVSCQSARRGSHRVYTGQTCTGTGTNRHCTDNYTTFPDYDMFCNYTVDRWVYVRSVTSTGETGAYWPVVDIAPCTGYSCEREGIRLQSYDAGLGDKEGNVYHCQYNQDTWQGIKIGSEWLIDIYDMGSRPKCETLRTS